MARRAKPWFRSQDGWWYLRINGKPERLVHGADQSEEADRLYHKHMAQPRRVVRSMDGAETVQGIIDRFLAHLLDSGTSDRTAQWYSDFLEAFAAYCGPDMLVDELKPLHVTEWIDGRTQPTEDRRGWQSGSTKHGAVRSVRRAFRWAVDQGYIDRYPLAGLKGYQQTPREVTEGDANPDELIAAIRDDVFRDLVVFVVNTGCRPQEARAVTVDMVHGSRVVFPKLASKGKRTARVIHCNQPAQEIVARLVAKHKTGLVFRNTRGKPWTKNSLNCRFRRLRKKLGKRTFAYLLRHQYATEALKNDVDPISLAALIGHADPTMLARVYAHVSADQEHMARMAAKATPKPKPKPAEVPVKKEGAKKK